MQYPSFFNYALFSIWKDSFYNEWGRTHRSHFNETSDFHIVLERPPDVDLLQGENAKNTILILYAIRVEILADMAGEYSENSVWLSNFPKRDFATLRSAFRVWPGRFYIIFMFYKLFDSDPSQISLQNVSKTRCLIKFSNFPINLNENIYFKIFLKAHNRLRMT